MFFLCHSVDALFYMMQVGPKIYAVTSLWCVLHGAFLNSDVGLKFVKF